jgi:hypothetical protein
MRFAIVAGVIFPLEKEECKKVRLTDVDILFISSMIDLNSVSKYSFIQNRGMSALVG